MPPIAVQVPSPVPVVVPPPATAPEAPSGSELAALYRKIAALLAERAAFEARMEQAQAESAAADEHVGQMLVRVAEVEGRLRSAQKATADADERARVAEVQADELRAQLTRLRQAQVELAERFGATEARVEGDAHERERMRGALEGAQRDAEVARASEEEARSLLRSTVDQIESLRGELGRVQEESRCREERIAELEAIRVERDEVRLHEELLEMHLTTARSEVDKARRHALSGEHRLGAEIKERTSEIDRLREDLARARDERADQMHRQHEAERRAEAARAELAAFRAETEAGRARLGELEIERELHDGMAVEGRRAHEAETKRLREEAAEALSRVAEAMAMAEQFRSDMTAARRERDTLSSEAQRTRREVEQRRARAELSLAELRSVVEEVSRALSDAEAAPEPQD